MINIATSIVNPTIDLALRKEIAEYTDKVQFYIRVGTLKTINNNIDICILNLCKYLEYKEELDKYPKIKVMILLEQEDISNYPMFVFSNLYFISIDKIEKQLTALLNRIVDELYNYNIIAAIPNKGDKRIEIKELNYIDITGRNLGYHTINGLITGKTIRTSFSIETQNYSKHEELYLIKPSFMVNLTNIDELYPDHIKFRSGDMLYLPKTAYKGLKKKWKHFYFEDEE